jgi:Flp pilus assembly protein CpaB
MPADPMLAEPVTKRPLLSRLSFGHLIMVLAGLLAFLLVLAVLRERGDTIRIAVAAVDIQGGTTLDASELRYAEVSDRDAALLQAFLSEATIERAVAEGWIATRTIRAGIPLTTTDFRSEAVGQGLRVMSIPIAPEHAVNGALVAGDRVDVIAVRRGVAEYVVTDVEVISVSAATTSVGNRGFSLTIAVDEQTSLEVASAMNSGSLEVVRATGAAPADPDLVFDPAAVPNGTSGRG